VYTSGYWRLATPTSQRSRDRPLEQTIGLAAASRQPNESLQFELDANLRRRSSLLSRHASEVNANRATFSPPPPRPLRNDENGDVFSVNRSVQQLYSICERYIYI